MMHSEGKTVAKHWRHVSQIYMYIYIFIMIPTGMVPKVNVSANCLICKQNSSSYQKSLK